MGGAVKIECEDISSQELRQLAGRVKDGRVKNPGTHEHESWNT